MLEKLKAERISAMKEKNTIKKNVLSTLIGEIERENKSGKGELKEQDIIKLIKKMVENNITTGSEDENQYIDIYLPKMLSENELETIISKIIEDNNLEGMKGMGVIMKNLNQHYAGQFDGSNASSISKKILL